MSNIGCRRVLEICPYEPPASGWVNRVKLLRRVIQEYGGTCEILDIGPSRKLRRPGCIPVDSGFDYFAKVLRFANQGYTFHCHINGEYFRGLLLASAALFMARILRNRCLVTFHAGPIQPFLAGWKRKAVAPIFMVIFALSHAVICNSEAEKKQLINFTKTKKIFPIPAFSKQYLKYNQAELDPYLDQFIKSHSPLCTTYLCYRDGFYTDVVINSLIQLVRIWPDLGMVIVGTGDGLVEFEQEIRQHRLEFNIWIAGDCEHDAFMTLLSKSQVYLRTHVRDGVSSSILEALSLRIPVVASENQSRPDSVVTYKANDPAALTQALDRTFRNHAAAVASVVVPEIQDTAKEEVALLFGEILMAPQSA